MEKLFSKLYSRLYGFPIIVLRIMDNAGDYVHKPGAKLPYSKVKARGISIVGLPGRCKVLKHPSSYGR